MSEPYLHVYAQPFWHQEAYLVGNKEALTALRDAINRALERDCPGYVDAYTGDGEGFSAFVMRNDDEQFWGKALLPYTDEGLFPGHEGIGPWELLKDFARGST